MTINNNIPYPSARQKEDSSVCLHIIQNFQGLILSVHRINRIDELATLFDLVQLNDAKVTVPKCDKGDRNLSALFLSKALINRTAAMFTVVG
ncbi:MAG: hypothetical protein SAK29_27260 [Scytonema sp. PMC 1069.18]|nr:hypothetical protein [Scytonema sp. PMC 1069.18]MEC4886035.1 hypothetical protein [Scytonema sp. PMC 1070.18]